MWFISLKLESGLTTGPERFQSCFINNSRSDSINWLDLRTSEGPEQEASVLHECINDPAEHLAVTGSLTR